MNQGDLAFNGFSVSGPERDTSKNSKDVMRYTLTVWLQKHDENKKKKIWHYDDDGKLIEQESSITISNPPVLQSAGSDKG